MLPTSIYIGFGEQGGAIVRPRQGGTYIHAVKVITKLLDHKTLAHILNHRRVSDYKITKSTENPAALQAVYWLGSDLAEVVDWVLVLFGLHLTCESITYHYDQRKQQGWWLLISYEPNKPRNVRIRFNGKHLGPVMLAQIASDLRASELYARLTKPRVNEADQTITMMIARRVTPMAYACERIVQIAGTRLG